MNAERSSRLERLAEHMKAVAERMERVWPDRRSGMKRLLVFEGVVLLVSLLSVPFSRTTGQLVWGYLSVGVTVIGLGAVVLLIVVDGLARDAKTVANEQRRKL